MAWIIDSDILINDTAPEMIDSAMVAPYPEGMWRVEDDMPTQKLLAETIDFGAFANATSLTQISIPRSCKKIGRYAFANTQLTSVTVASDCVYYDTSFPAGCVVNFYPD